MFGNSPETSHPDADLLTAFAEQRLAKKERSQVAGHLAMCAECREVVALALLAKPEGEPVTPEARRAPRLLWPAWGWRAAVVGVSTVVICFALYRAMPPGLHQTTISEKKTAPPAAASTQTAQRASVPAAEGAKPQGILARPTQAMRVSPSKAKDEQAEAKSPTMSTDLSDANRPQAVEAATPPAPPREALRADKERPAGIILGGPVRGAQPPEAQPVRRKADADEVTAGPLVSSQAAGASKLEQPSVASGVGSAPQPAGAEACRLGAFKSDSLAQSRELYKAKKSGLVARWSISVTGKVEHSLDGGKTWEELHVNDSLIFRVVTAAKSEVWAGGARGALYHSVDGGEHWTRVYLNPDQSGPDDAIVGINFSDILHGRVTTAADERWITSDGGRHWTRE